MALASRSHVEPIDPSLLSVFVAETYMDQYFQVATVSVLLYDTLLTLDKEQKLPSKPVNVVFFANRYIGTLGATAGLFYNLFSSTLPLCHFALWSSTITNWIVVISVDYVLMVRVLALYSQDKALAQFLKSLLLLEAASKLGLVIYLTIREHPTVIGFETMTFCGIYNVVPWQLGTVDWLIPLVYGFILMIFAVYKATEYWRMSSGFKGFTLVKVLIQDQIMYYALVIGCSTFAILQFRLTVRNDFLGEVLNNIGRPPFLCVLGSRMILNMKEAGERGENEGTSYRSPASTMSEMDFAEAGDPESEMEASGFGANP